MTEKKKALKQAKTSSQVITDPRRVDALERLAGRLGVAPSRVLDAVLEQRSDTEIAAFVQAQRFAADPTQPVPVLLDGAVVAAVSGQITKSVSFLMGSLLPDILLAVLAHHAERRPELLAATAQPLIEQIVPLVLDRLIAAQLEADLP